MTTEPREPIKGIVELVIDDHELLIDKGAGDHVQIGMRFAVLGKAEIETVSGRTIEVEYPKLVVKIVRFDESGLAVGRTFRTKKGRPGRKSVFSITPYDLLGDVDATPDRVETIKTEQGSTLRDRLGSDAYRVKDGDPVRETKSDEFPETI